MERWAVPLGVDLPDHMPFYVGQPEITACVAIGQAFMIQAHEIQNRRVKVMDMDFVLGGVVTVIIG